ncbi:C-reactive protein-like [Archocentrus centrarchus]|uniref:C-reactive protein-like n=1 Tax=Archocentrus centrarchus TaxID=63155 RepID=UPI0011E9D34F|nr:C-reactive protein-like [Archocentrus centrarchus]XP_030585169.1 C-reactive protein-like [Archocentrus centrarchus]
MKLLLVLVLMVIIPTVVEPATEQPYIWERATGASAVDLRGKMFTLARSYGGITFYPPNYHSSTPYPTRRNTARSWTTAVPSTTRPYTFSTRAWTTSSDLTTTRSWTPTYPWTTRSPTRGVSVCLRYMTDQSYFQLFTLSPDRSPLTVGVNPNSYQLTFDNYNYNYVNLQPLIVFWPNTDSDFWTSMCITVDTRKGVAQLFSGRNMSVRKVLSYEYVWSGEPVIDFSGFDGQLTDVQVWDYALYYKEIFYYMTRGRYESYRGSVLSWSYISYSPRGRALMEESYGLKAKQPIRKVAQKRGLKREKLKKKKKLLI